MKEVNASAEERSFISLSVKCPVNGCGIPIHADADVDGDVTHVWSSVGPVCQHFDHFTVEFDADGDPVAKAYFKSASLPG